MKISLIVIGKTGDSYMNVGITEYTKRLSYYIPFDIQYISDIKNTKSLTESQQKHLEGQSLLNSFDKSDYVVLLDEHGKEYTSSEFAKYISKKMISVPKRLIFVVGGPYGFSDEVKSFAKEKISLSKMTFSHEMIRLIFTEQLYRAMTILNNEPYHHE